MDDYSPLFASRLEAVRSDDNYGLFGGKIKTFSVQKFDLQSGPTCGLVSIRIAALALKIDNVPNVNELLEFCQKNGYTKNGECFSVEWLGLTVLNFIPNVEVQDCKFPSAKELINIVLNNGVYLIPYDSDKDFGPCNNNGKNAHWLTLTGFFLLDKSTESIVEFDGKEDFKIDDSSLYLIGYQGKSRSAGIYTYSAMRDSNSQLNEHSQNLLEDSILPEGGIVAGLKGQVLKISKSTKVHEK